VAPREVPQGAVRRRAGEVVQVADNRQRPRPRWEAPLGIPSAGQREDDERYGDEGKEQQVRQGLSSHDGFNTILGSSYHQISGRPKGAGDS
jgi:hypothetical protein